MDTKTAFPGVLPAGTPLPAIRRPGEPYQELDAYVQRQMDRLRIPGAALAVVEGQRIAHLRGFGQARLDGRAPDPQTPFPIGSVTKSFTALAVMQLVESGRIDLDAPVQRYLPWFRVADSVASNDITVRHLLNQTSGLPGLAGEVILAESDNSHDAARRQAQALATVPLTRSPGAAYEYSNSNYQLLGLIIESAAGEDYGSYVRRHIFDPLEMRQSYTSLSEVREDTLAAGHQLWFGRPYAAPDVPVPHGALAAGLLISSAEDLAHYLIAHLNGGRYGAAQLLSAAGIDEMHRGAVDATPLGLGSVERLLTRKIDFGQYGMGWNDTMLGATRLVWHGGTLPNFGAYVALLPGSKKGIALLFNACHHWMNPVYAELGAGAAALLAGERPPRMPFISLVPWIERAPLIIPAIQIGDVATTLGRVSHRNADHPRRTVTPQAWRRHFVIPTLLNVAIALLTLRPLLSKRRGYLRLYMPDFYSLAAVCGGFAVMWTLVRAGLVIKSLKKPE